MSGLRTKRAWFGSAAIISVLSVAACGDEGGDDPEGMAGKAGGGGSSGGKAGAPNQGGDPGTSGNAMGGKAGNAGGGKAGMASTDGGMGGDDPGVAGDTGVGGSGGSAGSGGEGGELSLADQVRAKFAGMSPLPAVPADTTNQYADNAAAATLGQRFFFDEKFSGALVISSHHGNAGEAQKVSCAGCHSGPALDDELSVPATVSIGTNVHTRNSPAIVNSAFYTWTNWGGRFSAQWELPLAVVESPVIMAGNRLALAHRIFDVYQADYEAVFGDLPDAIGTDAVRFPPAGKPKGTNPDGPWETVTGPDQAIINRILVNYSKAIQAYMRKLVSREAPFDLLMAGDDSAMTESQMHGALAFASKGCTECHSGPTFSDQKFHDLGVPQTGLSNIPTMDDGRFKDTTPGLTGSLFNRDGEFSDDKNTGKLQTIPSPLPEAWKGAFRTPSLRGVSLTAPYMHSGQFTTLSDVLDFYEVGPNANTGVGEPLAEITISLEEKADMIAFLGALSGKPITQTLLDDTAAP